MGLLDKVRGLLSQNADKVEQAAGQIIDKAGDIVDEKTGSKYTGAVDKVQEVAKDAAKKAVGEHDESNPQN